MLNKERTLGVDFTEFTGFSTSTTPVKDLLYYGNAQLTDKYYIKNVYTWNGSEFTNKGEHFMHVVGEVQEGDFLTTSSVRGAAIKTDNKDLAFAQVITDRIPEVDSKFDVVGACYAVFL